LAASTRAHWATATDLAGVLVEHADLSWRSAHQITGIGVRLAEERGLDPSDVTPSLIDEAAAVYRDRLSSAGATDVPAVGRVSQADIDAALDPAQCIESRKGLGGPAASEVTAQLASLGSSVAVHSSALADHRAHTVAAKEALDAATRDLTSE
jgi:argininosuccinate lyase